MNLLKELTNDTHYVNPIVKDGDMMKAKASFTRNVRRYKVITKIKIGAHFWTGEFTIQASTPKEAQKIGREIVNLDMERVNSIGYKIISDSAVLIGTEQVMSVPTYFERNIGAMSIKRVGIQL